MKSFLDTLTANISELKLKDSIFLLSLFQKNQPYPDFFSFLYVESS